MTRQRALRLAREWAQGHVCSLREGEAQEYHQLVVSLLETERLPCDGCVAAGTGYGPCMNCIRSKPRRDLYRRPPERQEDANA